MHNAYSTRSLFLHQTNEPASQPASLPATHTHVRKLQLKMHTGRYGCIPFLTAGFFLAISHTELVQLDGWLALRSEEKPEKDSREERSGLSHLIRERKRSQGNRRCPTDYSLGNVATNTNERDKKTVCSHS